MRKGAAAHPHRRFSAKQSEPTPIDACCDRRQACDSICGTSTKFCDAELKACADKACDGAPDKEECDRKKSMMQLMQSMDQGACKRHTDGQVAACKCVKPDEAPARRLKTIKEVYEKNKGDASKAEGLAAKADTSKKFGALLHKLVAKYPAMIKKVADPQQEYWEKIMKEGIDKKATDDVVDGAEEDEDVEDLDAADEL